MVEKKEEDNQQEEIKEPDSENIENDEDFMVLDVNKDNIVESIKAKFD